LGLLGSLIKVGRGNTIIYHYLMVFSIVEDCINYSYISTSLLIFGYAV
jgi:hypothetical protein